jgi:hypothetical protein
MKYRMSDKGHTVYKTKDGKRVPSVSTISSVMDKPALVSWANRLGLEGIDTRKYVDALANAGTLAHYFVECEVLGQDRDSEFLREFSAVDLERAETSFVKFLEWKQGHDITLLASELELVSETHLFGGRLDLLLLVDEVLTLTDIKTCKALYGPKDEKWCQLAGYAILSREAGYEVKQGAILRLGREPNEGFEFAVMPKPELQEERFLICRALYDVNSRLGSTT